MKRVKYVALMCLCAIGASNAMDSSPAAQKSAMPTISEMGEPTYAEKMAHVITLLCHKENIIPGEAIELLGNTDKLLANMVVAGGLHALVERLFMASPEQLSEIFWLLDDKTFALFEKRMGSYQPRLVDRVINRAVDCAQNKIYKPLDLPPLTHHEQDWSDALGNILCYADDRPLMTCVLKQYRLGQYAEGAQTDGLWSVLGSWLSQDPSLWQATMEPWEENKISLLILALKNYRNYLMLHIPRIIQAHAQCAHFTRDLIAQLRSKKTTDIVDAGTLNFIDNQSQVDVDYLADRVYMAGALDRFRQESIFKTSRVDHNQKLAWALAKIANFALTVTAGNWPQERSSFLLFTRNPLVRQSNFLRMQHGLRAEHHRFTHRPVDIGATIDATTFRHLQHLSGLTEQEQITHALAELDPETVARIIEAAAQLHIGPKVPWLAEAQKRKSSSSDLEISSDFEDEHEAPPAKKQKTTASR